MGRLYKKQEKEQEVGGEKSQVGEGLADSVEFGKAEEILGEAPKEGGLDEEREGFWLENGFGGEGLGQCDREEE